jgi:transglutaminase-like putative cysteine protease
MPCRLAVEHNTAHQYEGDVLASYNEVRISPRDSPGQVVLDHRLHVRPAARVLRYVDYWGTEVCAFDIHEPHDRLVVSGRSLVETGRLVVAGPRAGWDDLESASLRDRYHEFLNPSQYVPTDPIFGETSEEIARGLDPYDAVLAISEWVRASLAYEPGATDVSTTAAEALRMYRGVCQDFVHVAIGLLRAIGIPARYASGYLHPNTDPLVDETVVGEGHAWLEAWTGAWESVDPTNGSHVGERHVLVARGRDYGDVSPVKGICHGPPHERVEVRVAITRVA